MTGITKDELMQMARDAGLLFNEDYGTVAAHDIHKSRIERFTNAILERAAVECESIEGIYWNGDGAYAAMQCHESIRALKINTGD